MAKCPNCGKEISRPQKEWTYAQFEVQAFLCDNCNTKFREYMKNGKYAFALKTATKKKGQIRYVKV